jgi:hypothetical protein
VKTAAVINEPVNRRAGKGCEFHLVCPGSSAETGGVPPVADFQSAAQVRATLVFPAARGEYS